MSILNRIRKLSSLCSRLSTFFILLVISFEGFGQYCSGTTFLTGSAGTIHDGSSAAVYASNSNCFWLIQPTTAAYISLIPTYLQLEENVDFVYIYDGPTTAYPLLASFTAGNEQYDLPPSLSSSGGSMLIHFVTNASNNFQGWSFDYVSEVAYPDLVPTLYSLTPNATSAANSIFASARVDNLGVGQSVINTRAAYYLSTDNILDAGDELLGSDDVEPLLPGTGTPEDETLDIPAWASPGNYYIIYQADYKGELAESNEANNTVFLPLTINGKPDYIPYIQSVSAFIVNPGDDLIISGYVENNSAYAANVQSRANYFLSANTVWDAGDVLIGSDDVEVLAPFASSSEAEVLTIPSNTSGGLYYILWVADTNFEIDESNEANNTAYVSIVVSARPDLIVQNQMLSSDSLLLGESFMASCEVKNVANAYAGISSLGYYLSENNTYGVGDIYLGEDAVSDLGAGNSSAENQLLSLPPGINAGTYFVLFKCDDGNQVNEENELNNVSYVQIEVIAYPDLKPQSPTLSRASVLAGNTTQASCRVHNIGNETAAASKLAYFLSSDSIYDAFDAYLAEDDVVIVPASGNYFVSKSLSIAAETTAGAYYILFVADYYGVVEEGDENNNVISLPITVEQPIEIPQANFSASDTNICVQESVLFTDASTNTPTQWLWSFIPNTVSYINGTEASSQQVEVQFEQAGLYTVSLTVSNANGEDMESKTDYVNVSPDPVVDLAIFPTLKDNDPPLLLTQGTPLGGVYTGVGISGNSFDPSIGVGNYLITYTYTDAAGCTAEAQGLIVVENAIAPPFTWYPTNQSGLFIGQAQVDSLPASGADWIAAFDQAGNCAGAAQLIISDQIAYINLPIYGDDPTTANLDEGINSGESFKLVLFDASEAVYLDYPHPANISWFTQWANTNGTPIPTYNDPDQVYNFQFVSFVPDVISLNAGWNLISLDVMPEDSAVASVFGSLSEGNLEFVTGFQQGSMIYDPNGPVFFNTLNYVARGHAYWVKVQEAEVLTVLGNPIDPDYKKDLDAGWNLVAYLPQQASLPSDYFAALVSAGKLIYVTGFDQGTTIYNPNGPPFLNTLHSLNNGKGYWLRVSVGVDGNDYRIAGDIRPNPSYMFLNGRTNLSQGQVDILRSNGEKIGRMDILPGGYLMTTAVYGDDPSTHTLEGLQEGDELYFAFQGQIIPANVHFQPEQLLASFNLSFAPQYEVKVYPNPSNGKLQCAYSLPQDADVKLELLDIYGHQAALLDEGKRLSGKHKVYGNAPDLAEGIYLVSLLIDGKMVYREKLVMLR